MRIKRVRWLLGLVVSIGFIWPFVCEAGPKYAAKVNGVGIPYTSLEAAVNNFIENQKRTGVNYKQEDKVKLRKDILEELINAELLYQESKKAGLGDLTKQVERQYENIKGGFGSEEAFKKVLEGMGITPKALKNDIRKGVYIETFLDKKLYKDININEDEKKKEYEKNKDKLKAPEKIRARHILIRVSQNASEEEKKKAKEKIKALRSRALAGEDFAKLAKENSEDGSAKRGGDLGYFSKGVMVKPFEDAAFNLQKGQVSDVVETQFGYHIIKLIDRVPAHMLTYEEVKNDIERFLVNKYKRQKLSEFVKNLRDGAKIERFIP